jgi:hypothetical protein
MKKIFLTLFLSFLAYSCIFSQVDGIKEGSDKNKTTTTTTTTTTTSTETGKGDGCLSDACGTACASGCFDWVLENAILGIVKFQKYQLEKRDDIPEVVSLELMPHFGYAEPSSSMLMPRIRGNWGLFSTDLRYTNMAEYTASDGVDFYNTLDWQILEFNVIITEPVIFRFGGGIMYEYYSSSAFLEYLLGLDANWMEHQYLATGEFRIAKDYSTGATPRLETNLRFNYRILKTQHLNGYAMLGGMYQNYYNSVDVWTAQTGFAFNFH